MNNTIDLVRMLLEIRKNKLVTMTRLLSRTKIALLSSRSCCENHSRTSSFVESWRDPEPNVRATANCTARYSLIQISLKVLVFNLTQHSFQQNKCKIDYHINASYVTIMFLSFRLLLQTKVMTGTISNTLKLFKYHPVVK
jgi:hypothetical protein